MTEEEIIAAALSDPDCPPSTPEQLARFKRVNAVKDVRRRLDMTQAQFATAFRLPLATVRDWEQERSTPDAPARALLTAISRDPQTMSRLVGGQAAQRRVDLTGAQIEAARTLGDKLASIEPRAASARYDHSTGRIVVELTNGSAFAFLARLGQGLEGANDEQLAQVGIQGAGYGLHWESLDVDLSIPGLAAGIFGTKAHMARIAGQETSAAKAAAARANGAKGGRPRKVI